MNDGRAIVMLLAAAQAAGNRPRFVYLSATGVRGPADGNAYMRARGRVEAAVRSSGLPFRVLDSEDLRDRPCPKDQ